MNSKKCTALVPHSIFCAYEGYCNLCVLAIFQKQSLLVCQTPLTTEIDLDQPIQLVIWSLVPAEVVVL